MKSQYFVTPKFPIPRITTTSCVAAYFSCVGTEFRPYGRPFDVESKYFPKSDTQNRKPQKKCRSSLKVSKKFGILTTSYYGVPNNYQNWKYLFVCSQLKAFVS